MASLMDAVQDGRDLVAWAEVNTIVLGDEQAEAAVLASFGGKTDPAHQGVPLLRPCDPARESLPLVDAVVSGYAEHRTRCDRCGVKAPIKGRLWVPAGASVAELACCHLCRGLLADSYAGIVWR